MEEMAKLGELIRTSRGNRGMEARYLASQVGMHPGSLSNLERGVLKNTPDAHTLRSLSAALGVPVLRMLETLGYLDADASTSDPPAVSAVRAILEGREFTDKQIRQLATMVRGMVEMMEV